MNNVKPVTLNLYYMFLTKIMGPVLFHWIMLTFTGFSHNTASASGYWKRLGIWICYDTESKTSHYLTTSPSNSSSPLNSCHTVNLLLGTVLLTLRSSPNAWNICVFIPTNLHCFKKWNLPFTDQTAVLRIPNKCRWCVFNTQYIQTMTPVLLLQTGKHGDSVLLCKQQHRCSETFLQT